jgi:hypothetical protein
MAFDDFKTKAIDLIIAVLDGAGEALTRTQVIDAINEAKEIIGDDLSDPDVVERYKQLVPYYQRALQLPEASPTVLLKPEEDISDPAEAIEQPKLPVHDIDVPEEPETVHVISRVWDSNAKTFVTQDLGSLLLVPTGCEQPEYLSPYTTECKLRLPLPRNKMEDANLYTLYQNQGWASRAWVRSQLDEEIDGPRVDKEIADDIPFMLALKGLPDPSGGVAQTEGADPQQTGGNNESPAGAPAAAPGAQKMAAKGGGQKPALPANAKPGTPV